MKNMKQLFGLLLLAAAFSACSDDKTPVVPNVEYDVISFETSEAMLDAAGMDVELREVEIGGFIAGKYNNVLCGKEYMMEEDFNGDFFDGLLFTTADGGVGFGSYFSNFRFGGNYDTWGGFALSRNFSKATTANGQADYPNCHFSGWATKGANNSETFALAYYNGYAVYDYHTPKIKFETSRKVSYIYLANATLTAQYVSPKADYYFKVIATGYSNNTKGNSVEQILISGTNIVSDWVKVDLSSLGKVDEIRFSIDTNDKTSGYPNCPSYFCIDEIGVEKLAE